MPAFQGLPQALRWLRTSAHRKQGELASASGITQAMLCAYEKGKREPSLRSLEKILDALGADASELARVLALVHADWAREAPDLATRRRELPPPAKETLSPAQRENLRQIHEAISRWHELSSPESIPHTFGKVP